MFIEIAVELNNKSVTDPNQLYPYRAYLETLLNFSGDVEKNRLRAVGWIRDTDTDNMDPEQNADSGVAKRAAWVARSRLCELVGRPHLDLFHQNKLLPPGVNMLLRLIPANDAFVIKTTDANAAHRILIQEVKLRIKRKQLTPKMELAHRETLLTQNMLFPYDKVQMKHYSIPQHQSRHLIDNVFTGSLPDVVIVALVSEADFNGGYGRNPFNFQTFNLSDIRLKRNGQKVPRSGYTPDFPNNIYMQEYMTLQEQLGTDIGDKCVPLTPEEWAHGFTVYAFKITDGPIGPGTDGPRSNAIGGNATLEFAFNPATQENIKAIIMYQMFFVLEIDRFNNIITM